MFTDTPVTAMYDDDEADYKRIVRAIWMFGSPLLLVIGTVGNVLSFLVMGRRKLRDTLFGVYLRCIAVCDTGHLWLGLFVQWGSALIDFDFSATSTVMCKLREFIFHSLGDVAIWAVCAITVERVFVVLHSSSRKSMPLRRAIITITLLALLAVVKNTHMLWTRGLEMDQNQTLSSLCGYKGLPGEYYERYIRTWIVFVFVTLLPVMLLLTCNTYIIIKLRRINAMKAKFVSGDGHARNDTRHVVQATVMCLSVSFAFVLLVSPTMILLVGRPYWTTSDSDMQKYQLSKASANFLIYVHHSINFYLYCLSGKRFRQEFMDMIKCRDELAAGQDVAERLT